MGNNIKRITINTSRDYDVLIGSDLLSNIEEYIPDKFLKSTIVIITDSNVEKLYAGIVQKALRKKFERIITFSFKAGENSKNINTLSDILEFLAINSVTRSDLILALGGGVVGDIAGFAAGIYLRGLPYIGVPTTFLASIDSSVGGKTAIDLKNGKNLAGVFYHPILVITDTGTFKTLSDDTFSDGTAETLKHGIIADANFFHEIAEKNRKGLMEIINLVVQKNIEIKASIVIGDEFDTGKRQLLNLGHTAGHAIEKISNYEITHGKAVAMGLAIIARAAEAKGYLSDENLQLILEALKSHSLPSCADFNPQELYQTALSDKKRSGGKINIVVPLKIGECKLFPIEIEELLNYFTLGVYYER